MKTLTKIIAGSLMMLLATFSALALDPAQNVFCVGTTNPAAAASWAIVSPRSGNGGPPVVTCINYATDASAKAITAYLVTTNNTVTNWIDSTHVQFSGPSNVWAAGDNLVIWHRNSDFCERRIVSTILLTNIMTLSVAPHVAITNNDILFRITNSAAPQIWATWSATSGTNTLSSVGGLLVGQAGKPMVIEVNGSSAATLGSASGFYAPPATIGTQPNR
jgi:hypothetical protein